MNLIMLPLEVTYRSIKINTI